MLTLEEALKSGKPYLKFKGWNKFIPWELALRAIGASGRKRALEFFNGKVWEVKE